MGFNPFEQRGISIEQQFRNWSELNITPYDRNQVHPYTRTRVILMNGIEVEGALFSHQFARHTADLEVKRHLALTRRIEQEQQKAVNWLIPGNESVLEVTIGYEQVAVDLTAHFARTEPDPYVKQALDFGLLEDFDHLYRYANLMDMLQEKKAGQVTREFTEIMPGRPTVAEHRHPFDEVRRHYDGKKAHPLTKLHVLTIVAAEQQTMNFYMTVGNRLEDQVGRGLYLEIGQVEEQHVTHYESLADPHASWFERLLLHEYNECYNYYSHMMQEEDTRIKQLWELMLNMEIEHLRIARELMQRHEKRDAFEVVPAELPQPLKFQSNVDYIRDVLAKQVDLTAQETEFVPVERMDAKSRYLHHQHVVNAGGVPSEQVIDNHIKRFKHDYRQELGGPHPVERLRAR